MTRVGAELREEAAKAWTELGRVVANGILNRPDDFVDPVPLEHVLATDDPERIRRFISDVNGCRWHFEQAIGA